MRYSATNNKKLHNPLENCKTNLLNLINSSLSYVLLYQLVSKYILIRFKRLDS
jgi:hypothetical protein